MKVKKVLVLLVLTCFFVNILGCAALQSMDPTNIKGNHARAGFVNKVFIGAFNDHVRYSNLSPLRSEAIDLLNAKREVLIGLKIPVSLFNGYVVEGKITDAAYHELLNLLLDLEMGWYTEPGQAIQSPTLALKFNIKVTPESEAAIRKALEEAGLLEPAIKAAYSATFIDPIIIIELIRIGIHALNAVVSQRGYDEVQMKAAWELSFATFNKLDPSTLKKL
jgi:hypothetical protein